MVRDGHQVNLRHPGCGRAVQLLVGWLASWKISSWRMTPAEILGWRLISGEIDGAEYARRPMRLNNMIEEALGKNGQTDRSTARSLRR
jgi:hypothetical protein